MAMGPERNAATRSLTRSSSTPLFIVAVVLATTSPASAQSVEVQPFVEVVLTYTDNLYLDVDGAEISSYIGQLNPGISLLKTEGRFTTSTYYRAQGLAFSDSSDLNTVFHQLDMVSTFNIVNERFGIDFDASIDQSVIDPRESIPVSNVAATENLGDVYSANVNPYFVQPLGRSTFLRLDYTWGMGQYDGFGLDTFSRVDDFTRGVSGAYIGTGQLESGLEWSISYNRQDVDYENISDYLFERAQLSFGIPITEQFRLVGLAGQESDLLISRQEGGIDSDVWEVGFRVNAGPRKSFEFRTGERFFGTSYFGNLEFEGRRLSASITYIQNPTTSALDEVGGLVIPFAEDGISDGDQPSLPDDIIIGPIRAEVYLAKTFRARIDLAGNRSTFYVAYFNEDREFLDEPALLDGSQDGQNSATAGFTYELGPRTEFDLSATRIVYDYADTLTSTDVTQVNLGLVRRLGRESELRFAYRHVLQETDSVSSFDNYTENAIDISLLKRF